MLPLDEMLKKEGEQLQLREKELRSESLKDNIPEYELNTETNLEEIMLKKDDVISAANEQIEMAKHSTVEPIVNVNSLERSTNSFTINNIEEALKTSGKEEQIKTSCDSFPISNVLESQGNTDTINEFAIVNHSFANDEVENTDFGTFPPRDTRRSELVLPRKSNDEQFFWEAKREELLQEKLESEQQILVHDKTWNAFSCNNNSLEHRKEELARTTYRQEFNNKNRFSKEIENSERSNKNTDKLRCFRSGSEEKFDILPESVMLQPPVPKSKRNWGTDVVAGKNEGEVRLFKAKNALPISRKKIAKPVFHETNYVGLTKISVSRLSAQKPCDGKQLFSLSSCNKPDVNEVATETRLRNLVSTYHNKEKQLDWQTIRQNGLQKSRREKSYLNYSCNSIEDRANNNDISNTTTTNNKNSNMNTINAPKRSFTCEKENYEENEAKLESEKCSNSKSQTLELPPTTIKKSETKLNCKQFQVKKFCEPAAQSNVPTSTTSYSTDDITDIKRTAAAKEVRTITQPSEDNKIIGKKEYSVAMRNSCESEPEEHFVEKKFVDEKRENNLLVKRIQIPSVSCTTSAERTNNAFKEKNVCDDKDVNTIKKNCVKPPITVKISRVNNSNNLGVTSQQMSNCCNELSRNTIANENVKGGVTSHDKNDSNELNMSTFATPVYAIRKTNRHESLSKNERRLYSKTEMLSDF